MNRPLITFRTYSPPMSLGTFIDQLTVTFWLLSKPDWWLGAIRIFHPGPLNSGMICLLTSGLLNLLLLLNPKKYISFFLFIYLYLTDKNRFQFDPILATMLPAISMWQSRIYTKSYKMPNAILFNLSLASLLFQHKDNNPISHSLQWDFYVGQLKKCSFTVVFLLIKDGGDFNYCVCPDIFVGYCPCTTTNCTARERLPGWQGVGRHNNHTNGLQTSKLISVCVTSFTAHVQHDNLLGRRWQAGLNVSRFLFLLSLLLSLSPQDENHFIIFLDTENFSMTNYPHFTLIRYIWYPFLITSLFCRLVWLQCVRD